MKTKLLVLVLFLLWVVPAFAQVDTAWVRKYIGPYGDDYANAIVVDDLKNVYVTGASRDSGTGYINDYATVKYDSLGVEQWVARYNGSPTRNWPDEARAIAVDANGVYVTGYISYYILEDSSDLCTIKYDKTTGDTIWLRKYDGANKCDQAYAIALDRMGNVYVTGKSKVDTSGFDYLTIKYSPDGVQRWTARYNNSNGNGWDYAYAIAVDIIGNVYVTGQSYDLNTYYDCTTVKYDSSGVEKWARRYSYQGNWSDEGDAIAVDDAENVYVTGRSVSTTSGWDYVTIKYNTGGTQLWAKRYNGTANYDDEATGIDLDDSGNIYVTGKSGIGSFYYQYATVKYLPNGTQDWVRTYIGPANLTAWSNAVVVDHKNNIYVTGYDYASDTTSNYVTIKYSPDGTEGWIARYSSGIPQGGDWATAVCVDQDNSVYVTGYSVGSETDYDYTTIKYFQSLCGDVTGDDVVDVGDVVYLINYLFKNGPAPDPLQAGDVNLDAVVDVGDVVYLINYLFKSGPPPCE
ncbi:MAG TPA: SBBP repeat-containing protein [candidate division Zixibacteria bacterium]